MGVTWAGALIALTIGYLNLITSSFAAILIGLGIDFGIHIVSQYEIENAHGRDCREAIGAAVRVIQSLARSFRSTRMPFSAAISMARWRLRARMVATTRSPWLFPRM